MKKEYTILGLHIGFLFAGTDLFRLAMTYPGWISSTDFLVLMMISLILYAASFSVISILIGSLFATKKEWGNSVFISVSILFMVLSFLQPILREFSSLQQAQQIFFFDRLRH